MKKNTIRYPDRAGSYFLQEKGVLALITISGIFYNVGMAAGPYFEGKLVQRLYDIMQGSVPAKTMLSLVLLYLGVIVLVQLMRAVKRFYVRVFANNISRSMRSVLYSCLVHMEERQLKEQNLGSLMTKAIADVDACAEGMRKFTTEIFDTGVVMVVYLVMLAMLDWRLTILSLVFTPFAYMTANRLKKAVAQASSAYKESSSSLNQMTMDRVSNAIAYRLFGREDNRNEAYEECLSDYEKRSARAHILEGSLTPIYNAVAMAGAVIILWLGSRNVTGTGWTAWDLAAFTTYLACFTKLAKKTSHAAKLFNALQKAKVSWARIKPMMKNTEDEGTDYGDVKPVTLSFDHVNCGYDAEKSMLQDVTFEAHPGEIIGITGMVASGKSMLGKVLIDSAGYEGEIRLNDQNFREMTRKEKYSCVSYMGHEPELLSFSIKENIALGEEMDVQEYLRAVCLFDEVEAMKEKEETRIGEAGVQLSGGQQARLALARTLAHGRSILVLDDPFSAVDPKTEREIFRNISEYRKDRIILLISHRLSCFPEMDQVLFIKDGRVYAGTHDELYEEQRDYADLYDHQTAGGEHHE